MVFEQHLISCQVPKTSILYIDGPSPDEKRTTVKTRESKRALALQKALSCIDDVESRVEGGRRVRKSDIKKLSKNVRAAFYWSLDSRKSLALYLISKGWNVVECPSEADTAIATDCQPDDIVVSGDSDMLIYDTVNTVWRPMARCQFLEYRLTEILDHLGISRAQLTTLGIVSKNDYTSNITQLGISTNHKIVKSLEKTEQDVEKLVQQYLVHPKVVCKNPSANHFEAAIEVFVRKSFGDLDSVVAMTTINEGAATQDVTQQSETVESILKRSEALRIQLREKKQNRVDAAQVEETPDVSNRYYTVDRPPEGRPRPHDSGRQYKYRERHAIKTRSQLQKHDPPDTMKQYQWKPWTYYPDSPQDLPVAPSRATPIQPPKDVTTMGKMDLVKAMMFEHPLRTLDIGTINANAVRALDAEFGQALDLTCLPTIKAVLRDVTRISSQVKRTSQRAIGLYIEQLSVCDISENDNNTSATNNTTLSAVDRALLNLLCPAFSSKDVFNSRKKDKSSTIQEPDRPVEPEEQLDDLEEIAKGLDKRNPAISFLFTLVISIHSRKLPKNSGMGLNHYKNGSIELCAKIHALKSKKLLPPEARDRLDPHRSVIENFMLLNRVFGHRRLLVPMSPLEVKFINLSELQLVTIFWKNLNLRSIIQSYAFPDFPSLEVPRQVSLSDVHLWLLTTTPGLLITRLFTDVGRYSEDQRKKLRDYSKSTFMMPVEEMRHHLQTIRDGNFEPASYTKNGYVLRGSIKIDGFRLQVLAFKLNELNAVKYRRLPAEKLPPRLTTTVGGTDYFLTEVRNVVSTKQDVAQLWGCDPSRIKILGIDLGQSFVVGASAILPRREQPGIRQEQDTEDGKAAAKHLSPKFVNLSVKQKAVYQPVFKHRRWLECRKGKPVRDGVLISQIETDLPPLRGPAASISKYIEDEKKVEEDLQKFYNNVVLKKHKWNSRKAQKKELRLIVKRLLQIVGGSPGAKRKDSNKVIIGIGLGKFSSNIRLSSLHESFQSYFVQMVSEFHAHGFN
ncbi:hypothetical protein BGX29_002902 [Mortierella sp. GBA35]|nr:hypothetical protein BGX29_002902 [Mortierella sp. GBA35]